VTALNLSWLLAQTDGVKALIIDSDLRIPSLTDYLGIETTKGLSHILSGHANLYRLGQNCFGNCHLSADFMLLRPL
jgi:MinD-like ATPase involved in chromosome partitioning or flagellar assembly